MGTPWNVRYFYDPSGNWNCVILFYLVSSTDHVTPVTGATVTSDRMVDAGSWGTDGMTGVVNEKGGGLYEYVPYQELTADPTNSREINYLYRFAATGCDTAYEMVIVKKHAAYLGAGVIVQAQLADNVVHGGNDAGFILSYLVVNLGALLSNVEMYSPIVYGLTGTMSLTSFTSTTTSLGTATANGGTLPIAEEIDEINTQLVDILSLVEAVTIAGAATYLAADSYTLVTGNLSSGTIEDTYQATGVNHVHTDAGGAIEVVYDFEMGASEVGVEVLFRGRVDGANDTIAVVVYDWIGGVWDTLWNQVGSGGSTVTNRAEPLLAKHTGTNGNDGKVRIGFVAASGLSSAALYVDQLLVAKTVTRMDLTPAAVTAIASAVWSAVLVSTRTAGWLLRKLAAILLGRTSGGGTTSEKFADVDEADPAANPSITSVADASGNRSSVTYSE